MTTTHTVTPDTTHTGSGTCSCGAEAWATYAGRHGWVCAEDHQPRLAGAYGPARS